MAYELRAWTPGELDKVVVKTEGYWVHYKDNPKILDMQAGNSAFILGYGNREVTEAMNEQINQIAFVRGNRGETCELSMEMGELLCSTGNWETYSWAVTGTSAMEAAVCMNDVYWKKLNFKRTQIVTFNPGYHGTSWLTKSMGLPHLSEFIPDRLLSCPAPIWKDIKDRDAAEAESLTRLESLVKRHAETIGCIVMETTPWFNGILPYSENWWKTIRSICDANDILMLTDDVAVCWGKGGSYHGYTVAGYGIQPDISALGKSLTAGYTPLGAAVCNVKVSQVLQRVPWEFGHTHQPNMCGVAAMKKVNEIIVRDKLFERIPHIEAKMDGIAANLMEEGYITNYRRGGLFMALDTDKPTSISNFVRAGLGATTTNAGSLKVIGMLNADDNYFIEMEKRLMRFFEEN